jgi:hypothetical protein
VLGAIFVSRTARARVPRNRNRRFLVVLALLACVIPLALSSPVGAAGPYTLLFSTSSNRSSPAPLEGATVSGSIYAFTSPDTADITRVRFWLDNPAMTGTPRRTESSGPYDFAGGTVATANPFRTATIADGTHTITAAVDLSTGTTEVVNATFSVQNTASPSLVFSPTSLSMSTSQGGSSVSDSTTLSTSNSSAASFTLSDNASWLSASPTSGTTTSPITVTADPSGLAPASYSGTVTAQATGYTPASVAVTLTVTAAGTACLRDGQQISPLPCSQVLVTMPYALPFTSDAGGIDDKDGQGTGFTMVEPATNGTGYIPANLDLKTAAPGTLDIVTTTGLMASNADSQDNALGVGVKPGLVVRMETTLRSPPQAAVAGKFEQAGLWMGNNEDNYIKLVLVSRGTNTAAPTIQLLHELDGVQSTGKNKTISLPLTTLKLQLEADPFTGTVTGYYSVNGAARVTVGSFTPPAAFFSADAAGIDPTIGTNTFGGIFATHRSGASPLTYTFDDFSLTDITPSVPPPPESFPFTRVATGALVTNATGMAFASSGKLYVTELMGKLHELTIDPATHTVTNDKVMTPIGTRLTTGIAVDPASTASNTILWLAHSDPDLAGPDPTTGLGGGAWDSSMVSRLSGTNFATRTDVITGLPRSQANHTLNSIHFGPDGKLYLAQGGNTGAGAPNHSTASLGEFGLREEQRLSAAMLVADVKAAGFDGSCATPVGDFDALPPCDVTTYSTGLRNAYDFVWHSNGSLYAPDNGASVGPSYPHSPTPDCSGFADPQSAFNPGDQNDFLFRLLPGKYYGHPNPARDECVFKDGGWQGVAPLPNYQPPLMDLGPKKSADGIIEYRNASAFGGGLAGSLLITNYSLGDNITRVKLSANGTSVVSSQALTADTFKDPLPIVEGPDGTLYVGEFFGKTVTALVPSGAPSPTGTWSSKAPLPVAILDAGGTELDGKLYFLAGKTSAGRRRTLYAYDPATNAWQQRASLPTAYPAVENPAVVAFNHKLYSFGGQTASFGSSVTSAAVYDPATNAWTMLPAMPIARGGATAEVIGTKAYLVGGFDTAGNSLASLSIYDLQAGTWSTGASMATRRDNPMSAVLTQGGAQKLFVFGGRTRNADGSVVADILASVEMYDPATNTWTPRAAMPTARRTGVVGTLNGKAQVMGGERSTTASGTFAANQEYDPATNSWRNLASMLTPRHGAVAGTIGGFVNVAGGGPNTGASYSAVNEAFGF